jgi:hypothetical protein
MASLFGLAPAPGEEPTGSQKSAGQANSRFSPEERKAMSDMEAYSSKYNKRGPATVDDITGPVAPDDATDWQ